MVLISSKKYACETCIKGHRSSTCKHTDRPLYEIKKKGRPVTQCEHCRELRKTKQVHVKCICEVKIETAPSQPPSGKKGTKIPHSATFPNGLPQELEVAVASHVQEGSLLHSHHGVTEQCSCTCKSGGPCVCWTPRHGAARRNTISDVQSLQIANADIPSPVGQPQVRLSMSHILARVKELRPVLPRPPSSDSSGNGPVHELASGLPHSHPNRHHLHDNVMFSPYGRAHDRAHDYPLHHPPIPSSYQPSVKGENFFDRSILELGGSTPQNLLGDFSLMSAGREGINVLSMDTATCLECSSLIPSISTSVQQDENQRVAIDEWLRQVPVPQSASDDAVFQQGVLEYPSSAEKPQRQNHPDSSLGPWDRATLFPPINHSAQPSTSSDDGRTHASTPDYCGNQCSCPPRSCQCRDRGSFCNAEAYSSVNGRMLNDDERFSLLQMSQGMSRSDTHLVLPDLYQTRPFSAPLQKGLGALRPGVSTMTDLPYSVSMSALDVPGGADYMGNSQSVVQALLDFPVTSNTSLSVPNLVLPWLAGSDGGNFASGIMPPIYPYAMSSSGTDGTSSSYDDLSMTLRTPL